MLDVDTAIEILRTYGYSSTTMPPYVYLNDETVGICYSYVDDNYGLLQRVLFFNEKEPFEEFVKNLAWVRDNGKQNNVRIILDNYEIINPKVMYIRNEKLMMPGEMSDITEADRIRADMKRLEPITRLVMEGGELLAVYQEIKSRNIEYLKSIISLRNELRKKYLDLQKEVDEYNDVEVEREFTEIPVIEDNSVVNELMEIAANDRFNLYKVQTPTLEEAKEFIKEVWTLNMEFELKERIYEAQVEENEIRNEMRLVDTKINFMKKLNDKDKSFFKVDVIKNFKRINRECEKTSNVLGADYVNNRINITKKKYASFDQLDIYSTSDYLKEAANNTNYGDLINKYKVSDEPIVIENAKKPLNEVAADLTTQFSSKLTQDEQAALILYNSIFRSLFDLILAVQGFENKSVREIFAEISKAKGFSKIKSTCYDLVKERLDASVNSLIKQNYFHYVNFSTFEDFIASIVNMLKKIKVVNNKMTLCGNVNMYFAMNDVSTIGNRYFICVTKDLNGMINTQSENQIIGITLLEKGLPVLYSPYYLDFGDIYSKKASPEIKLAACQNFEMLIDSDDVLINVDDIVTKVCRYSSTPMAHEDINVVDNLSMTNLNKFCKLALVSKINGEVVPEVAPVLDAVPESQSAPVETPVEGVVAEATVAVASIPTENQDVVISNDSGNLESEEAVYTEPAEVDDNQQAVDVQAPDVDDVTYEEQVVPGEEVVTEIENVVEYQEEVPEATDENVYAEQPTEEVVYEEVPQEEVYEEVPQEEVYYEQPVEEVVYQDEASDVTYSEEQEVYYEQPEEVQYYEDQ